MTLSSNASARTRPSVLVMVKHYPKPEHRQDLLEAMGRISASSDGVAGLVLEAAFNADGGSILAISAWDSMEAVEPGMQQLLSLAGDIDLMAWEAAPPEMSVLSAAI